MVEPTVSEYMTTTPASADEDLLLRDAEQRMSLDNIRHLVVVREQHLIGILSNRDIAVTLATPGIDPKGLLVRDAMTEEPYVCGPDAPISEVALQMETHRWGCAIVVESDEIVGVFTTTDALRALRALATGKPAEAAVKPMHLPPTEPSPRRFRLRRHAPIRTGVAGVFTTR